MVHCDHYMIVMMVLCLKMLKTVVSVVNVITVSAVVSLSMVRKVFGVIRLSNAGVQICTGCH
jgi:hypothetical protein